MTMTIDAPAAWTAKAAEQRLTTTEAAGRHVNTRDAVAVLIDLAAREHLTADQATSGIRALGAAAGLLPGPTRLLVDQAVELAQRLIALDAGADGRAYTDLPDHLPDHEHGIVARDLTLDDLSTVIGRLARTDVRLRRAEHVLPEPSQDAVRDLDADLIAARPGQHVTVARLSDEERRKFPRVTGDFLVTFPGLPASQARVLRTEDNMRRWMHAYGVTGDLPDPGHFSRLTLPDSVEAFQPLTR